MRRSVHIGLSLLTVLVLLIAAAGSSSAHQDGMHILKIKAAKGGKPRGTVNLFSHGGAIEQAPKVYIIYWGPQWQTGFTTGGHTSTEARSYVEGFFNGVGGSSWANSTIQYCQGVPSGTVTCGSASAHPGNLAGQLAGIFVDPTAVPTSPTQSQIAAEASAAAAQFPGGLNPQADYMVFTPTGHSMNGFTTTWCAWHSSSGNMSYSYMPYQPDAGASCGMNFVNGGSSGYFDGFSIVGGHEYAETITDPYPNSGWLDSRGAENGDKCAWISSGQGAAANISLGAPSHNYAVQSLWSNAYNNGSGGCVLSY
jgi:serine protease